MDRPWKAPKLPPAPRTLAKVQPDTLHAVNERSELAGEVRVKFPDTLLARMRSHCDAHRCSLSDYIRELVNADLGNDTDPAQVILDTISNTVAELNSRSVPSVRMDSFPYRGKDWKIGR